jgi:hypothetical protein
MSESALPQGFLNPKSKIQNLKLVAIAGTGAQGIPNLIWLKTVNSMVKSYKVRYIQ